MKEINTKKPDKGYIEQYQEFKYQESFENRLIEKPTLIEKKYIELITNSIKLKDFKNIKNEIDKDFSSSVILLAYVELIERAINNDDYRPKDMHEKFDFAVKLTTLQELFIATIRFNPKLWKMVPFHLKSFSNIDDLPFVPANTKVLPFLFGNKLYKGFEYNLTDKQSKFLDSILNCQLNWSIDKTFRHFDIRKNNYLEIKMFCLHKEIIKKNSLSKYKKHEYNDLIYLTYLKMLVAFISSNIMSQKTH